VTARAGRPEFLGILTLIVFGWIALNVILLAEGYRAVDEPPFPGLQGSVGLAALYMTALIQQSA